MNQQKSELQLVSARVTNYGCFVDSGEVPIDDVTALIAENENGKSTFLRALAWWDDDDEDFDEEDRWEGADPSATLDLVALTFDVEEEALNTLREAGLSSPPDRVRIVRNTQGEYRVEDAHTGEEIVLVVRR